MTTEQNGNFYANTVLSDAAVYSVVAQEQPIRAKPKVVRSRLLNTVAACAVSGIAVFGPFGASSPVSSPAAEKVVVHVNGPKAGGVVVKLPVVAVPEAHQRAADRFKRLFRAVPLHESEKVPDPDFGL